MSKKFERVEIKTEITRRTHDHEILLSFYDDDGAYAFAEWWNKEGSKLFNKSLKDNSEYKHIHENKNKNEKI